ncbi:MAG: peptidase S53, partial [Sulfolobus sp.]|nr:peptidase S53 [Sulfolobus sp.]
EVDIGESIGILEPVPFPYALSLGYNEPFNITVTVYYPNGTPVVDQTVSAYLVKDGSIYANLTLLMVKPGIYTTTYALLPPLPQGTYILEISSQYGEAYTYIYFGDMIFGGIITPVYDYLPSASPGNNITIFAEVLTPQFTGVFTSQVFASLISPKGKPIVNITLKPAPDIVLFGVFNLFFTYYGNLTVPNDVKPGFYNVIVYSETNSSLGVITGKFVTSLYISNYSLNVTVKVNPIAYEGQWLKIYANITYPNGTEVTEGSFTATIMPASLESEALVLGLEIGIPLQYNSTLNEWVGEFQVPSELQGSIYQGNTISWLSGPWAIFISGSAKSGQILFSNATYFYVEPYTYLGSKVNLNQNARSLPPLIAKVNKTTYVISNVYIGNLTVKGVTLELLNSRIGSITAIDSKVIIKDNEIGGSYIGIVSINSTLTILNSIISNVIYAFDQINSNITLINVNFKNVSEMSKVPPPTVTINVTNITIPEAVIQFTIFGEGLRIINVLMNGKPVHYFLTSGTENEIIIDIPFNASILPDGVYAFVFEISNGGLVYNETKDVINTYHQILSNEQVSVLKNEVSLLNASVSLERSEVISYKSAFYISSALAVIAIIIGVLGVIFIIRKR